MSKPVIGLLGLYAGLLAILVSGCTSFPSPEGSSYGTENPAGIVSGPTRTPPSSPPSRPHSISVVDRTSSSLTVAWSAPAPSATFYAFYELHRSSSERGDYSVVASDIASGKFVDQNLEPESVYYYVVRACNKLGCSDATDEIAAGITESATAVNAPETPPFIATTGKGLTWTGVKGATYYEVYGGGNLPATVSAPKTRSPHGGGTRDFLGLFDLSGGGVYQVRACNKAGCSTMTGTSHRGQFTLSIPEMMAGVCEHGLILKPGEACQVKDDTIALVEADANGFGEHAICVGTLHKRRCDNWGAQINEGLFASQSESGKEWVVIRLSRNPDPREEGRDPAVASIARDLFQAVGSGQASMDLLDGYIADGADINAPDSRGRHLLEWAIYREHTAQVKILIEAGADVNAVGSRGDTVLSQAVSSQLPDIARILVEEGADTNRGLPLIWALRFGRPEMVAILVKGGADVNARDSHGTSMLYRAIKSEDTEKVNILLDAGADVNHKNTDGPRLLHQAILSDNPEIVWTVIDAGVDVNARDANGISLLGIAIQYDNPEVVRVFIDAGADVSVVSFARQHTSESIVQLLVDAGAQEYSVGSGDAKLCRGYEDLHSAIGAFGKIEELVECVIRELGADVNATDASGLPVLYWAISEGRPEIVRALVDAGADVKATDDDGGKPMLLRAISENPEIVRVLLDAGADANATDYQGKPMLLRAISENPEIVRALVDAGADVNATDYQGNPMLFWAIIKDEPEMVRVLVDAGADVNATNSRDEPMLLRAIRNGNPEIVRVLVDAGADVNATDDRGYPMLYEAISEENPEMVRALVDAGVDVNATGDRGYPMLYEAISEENPEMVRLLVDAGADVNATDDWGRTMLSYASLLNKPEIVRILTEAGAEK